MGVVLTPGEQELADELMVLIGFEIDETATSTDAKRERQFMKKFAKAVDTTDQLV